MNTTSNFDHRSHWKNWFASLPLVAVANLGALMFGDHVLAWLAGFMFGLLLAWAVVIVTCTKISEART
jgi:hypothetical protein